jgi:ADP-L-glycero-D-manno-heptose 6-epimerase
MRCLVTGAAGFIGSNVALALEEAGHDVIALDNFQNARFSNLVGFKGEFVTASIVDVDWHSLGRFDYIFHQAAISDTRETDQEKVMENNYDSFKRMVEYALKNNTHIIYASSAAVYGNTPAPYKEDGKLDPLNVYGFSKMKMDHLAMNYAKKGIPIRLVGLRYFNVFGSREQHKDKFCSMIWQLSQQMLEGKRPRIFIDGEQKRDHVYVKDVVRANLLAMNSKGSCVVNVATGKPTTYNRIVQVLNEVLGLQLEPEYFVCPFDFFQAYTEADLTLAKEMFGYEPQWSFEDGVKDYMQEMGLVKKE